MNAQFTVIKNTVISFSPTHAQELCDLMGTDRNTLRETKYVWRVYEMRIEHKAYQLSGRYFVIITDDRLDYSRILEFTSRADIMNYREYLLMPTNEGKWL